MATPGRACPTRRSPRRRPRRRRCPRSPRRRRRRPRRRPTTRRKGPRPARRRPRRPAARPRPGGSPCRARVRAARAARAAPAPRAPRPGRVRRTADQARQTGGGTPARADGPTDPSGSSPEGAVASAARPEAARLADALPDRVVPTWADPVAVQASEAVGGPWGRHAVTGRALFWTPLRICLLFTTLVLALAWVKQVPCSDGDWGGFVQYTHFCYSDSVPLYALRGLDTGQVPYLDSAVEYPVLTGGFMALAAAISAGYDGLAGSFGLLPQVVPVQSYYVITCLLLTACAFLTVRAVLGLAGRRPWDAAMIGLSPLLFVHAFTNWDLFAIALSMLGLWAWARSRPVLAGVLIGLGIAAKFYPALLLVALALLCLRAGRWRVWLRTAVAAGGAWLVVNLPVALL